MDIRKVSISDSEQEQEPAPLGVFSFAEKLAMSKVDKHIGVNMKTVPRCRWPGGSVRISESCGPRGPWGSGGTSAPPWPSPYLPLSLPGKQVVLS